MNYICIENNVITAVLNYRPNAPQSVEVFEVNDDQYALVTAGTHFFDVTTKTVKAYSAEQLAEQQVFTEAMATKEFLNSSDWKVLRHIREKALGIATSLTDEAYLELEQQRETAAESLRK